MSNQQNDYLFSSLLYWTDAAPAFIIDLKFFVVKSILKFKLYIL